MICEHKIIHNLIANMLAVADVVSVHLIMADTT